MRVPVSIAESKYIEKKAYLSRYTHERSVAAREAESHFLAECGSEEEWLRRVKEEWPKFIPFLKRGCGVEFHGRVLEIGAGGGWFSAELSKLPKVVEITTTDLSPHLLKVQAPKVFKLLNAKTAKITRMPGDFHKLDFPDNHFDYVVCSAVLHHAANVVQVLREAKRLLKPGGRFVCIREPVWPRLKLKSQARLAREFGPASLQGRFYTLADYKEFFKQAALPVEVKRVNLARGFRYYVDEMVNRLTHVRYAFLGTKRGRGSS